MPRLTLTDAGDHRQVPAKYCEFPVSSGRSSDIGWRIS
ncbi:Uncharacterised protein [Amycolatopsis camponoti]|uniref:Uncharacterized protein n=1 Tax=Amycolatopsis camponoti TaxID=2606593 RepID=A0A6I8LLT3_9PSEU|nr:Uncharacterised protein [Amycolatopsis camponoti]